MWYLLLISLIGVCSGRNLGSYNVDLRSISVSGISSGACMATQLHVAFSSTFMGSGIVAGVPYYCAESSAVQSLECTNHNGPDPLYLVDETKTLANENKIDNTINLSGDRVFILQGSLDNVVDPANAVDLETYYAEFTSSFFIDMENSLELVHGFPTEDYGEQCDKMNHDTYINWCEYHGAYDILDHIYDGLQRPTSATNVEVGDFYEYEQDEFYVGQISMDDIGFIYVPSACIDKQRTCKLHIHLHGCNIGRTSVDESYVRNTFFDHVGELNDIIILYPQVDTSVGNPQGCWDWWGYTDSGIGSTGTYVTRDAPQMKAIMDMISRVTSQD